MVMTILATLAFTVAAVSLNHLNFTQRSLNGHEAQRAAESTIALALKELFEDSRYGEIRKVTNSLEYRSERGAIGHLTFWPDQATQWKVDRSTNNLSGTNPTEGYDSQRPLPPAAVQLVASGSYRGVQRRVETVIYMPPFPYAIASAGPLTSTGGLEVGALNDGGDIEDLSLIDSNDLVSAHIVSNSSDAKALSLGPDSLITGDVRAHGGILLDPKAVVHGQIRGNREAVKIPKEEVRSYDPQLLGKPNLQNISPGKIDAPQFEGFVRSPGSLVVSNGLNLNNGVLYVDGDLDVSGGIQGSGALFVTGNTHVGGTSDLTTDNSVAILTAGNVIIDGSDKDTSHFQGMVYSEGDFKANHIDLLGVFIQNGPTHTVEINDSRMISTPDLSDLQVRVIPPPPPLSSGNIYLTRDGDPFPTGKKPDSKGPIVMEAYPVVGGGWELSDPNTATIYSLADLAAVKAKVFELWTQADNHHLMGLDKKAGRTRRFSVKKKVSAAKLAASLDTILAGVTPRPAAQSQIVTPGTKAEILDLNPSRFLSFKDRMRILYWRS
ncbi:hypothetical protein ABS71_10725 [bacterium SCN 62-11]|nr:hypothetical protein [Candidatus Eremiobacteraeota bacterium]ODT67523.1 MAG: hypothetical protein ABS71_10725 [bacterium SCN 62-11]